MTNYGAIAILAALPEDAPARQLRVLIALETFKRGEDGWRSAGQVLLASTANVSRRTLQRARPELVTAELISYQPGLGRGVLSKYRIEIPGLEKGAPPAPVSTVSQETRKRAHPDPEKGAPRPGKGRTPKPRKSAVPAGHPTQNGHGRWSPALVAKATALEAVASSSAGGVTALGGADTPPAPPPGDRRKIRELLAEVAGITADGARQIFINAQHANRDLALAAYNDPLAIPRKPSERLRITAALILRETWCGLCDPVTRQTGGHRACTDCQHYRGYG